MKNEHEFHDEQAFPSVIDRFTRFIPGMTLRDWFAGQALIGMLQHICEDSGNGEWPYNDNDKTAFGEVAKSAYQFSDAMLTARDK